MSKRRLQYHRFLARMKRNREADYSRRLHRTETTGTPGFKGKPPGWHAAFAILAIKHPTKPIEELDRMADDVLAHAGGFMLSRDGYKQPAP